MPKHSSVPIPRDRSLPFAKLVDWQAEHNPTYAYAVLASPKPEDETVLRVNYHELGNAVHRAAHIINPIVNGAGTRAPGTVIGVLAVADAIVYQALVLAVMRSGNTVSLQGRSYDSTGSNASFTIAFPYLEPPPCSRSHASSREVQMPSHYHGLCHGHLRHVQRRSS